MVKAGVCKTLIGGSNPPVASKHHIETTERAGLKPAPTILIECAGVAER